MRNHGQVGFELARELLHVTHVIDSFVEASGEFRSNRLNRDLLLGNGGQNHQEISRSLRRIRLVHGNFRNEIAFAFAVRDVTIDASCFLDRE